VKVSWRSAGIVPSPTPSPTPRRRSGTASVTYGPPIEEPKRPSFSRRLTTSAVKVWQKSAGSPQARRLARRPDATPGQIARARGAASRNRVSHSSRPERLHRMWKFRGNRRGSTPSPTVRRARLRRGDGTKKAPLFLLRSRPRAMPTSTGLEDLAAAARRPDSRM